MPRAAGVLAGAVRGLRALGKACWPGSAAPQGPWRILTAASGAQAAPIPAAIPLLTPSPVPRSAFAVPPSADRPPSISAAQIDGILADYHSPAAGLGAVFYDQGIAADLNPAYLLSFFVVESAAGTRGVARTTHSVGNIRCTPGYACQAGYRATRSGNAERGTRSRAPLTALPRFW